LKVDDDVFIIVEEGSIFYQTNGKVKRIIEGKNSMKIAIVHFFPEFKHIFGDFYDQGITESKFTLGKLKKFNIDEYPEIKANRLYGLDHCDVEQLRYKFSSENICMKSACKNKVSRRILFNFDGSINEYDVCEEHAVIDGDSGPFYKLGMKYNYMPKILEPR